MKNKKIVLIVVIAAIAAAVIYFYLKGKKSLDGFDSSGDTQDNTTYQAMLSVFNADTDAKPNWSWMQPLVIKTYETGLLGGTGNTIDDFHRVAGKMTKSGALLQVYESTEEGAGWKANNPTQEKVTHQRMWDLFSSLKTQKEGAAFIAQ